ncbi:MAG TPA: SBBP repeat-containing protein, partial [Acidimicrobiales bacterium]|nr:SBBP repeat-containing protein [Acidimicrobiales bacterium]
MRRTAFPRRAVVLVLLGLVLATAATITPLLLRADAPVAAPPRASDLLAGLPVSFEPVGDGGFVSRGPGYSLSLTAAEALVGVRDGAFRLRPAGPTANPDATLVGGHPLTGTVTRLTGDDPARWSAGLSTFARVEAQQVWPGVDMVWHGNQRRLEHDMVVAPGVDPGVVALDVEGARSLTLGADGDLALDLGTATARLARPVVYQDAASGRRQVPGDFTLLGPSRIGFRIGAYDPTLPLVIDPTLVTSTFLGGIASDSGYAVAVDPQGNTYVTGSTESPDFPTSSPFAPTLSNAGTGATSDVFVSKISPDGSRLIWSTYLGGSGRDTGYAVAVANDGSVYVGGVTESANFPQAKPSQTAYGGGVSDAFVARIAANGSGVEWSTFVGGSQTDRGRGLAIDAGGNAYLTGSTGSVNFPAVNPQQPGPFTPDDLDAFLVKVPAGGGGLVFATRLGGGNADHGLAVAVDGQGSAYVTGDTLSPGFPTVRPLQAASGGSAGGVAGSFPDAFVSKYNPAGSALVYSTFLGGGDVDQGTAIAVDASGAAYVTGNTNSSNFPTTGPLQATKANDHDAFVTKVDPAGAALVYSTFFGGSGADGANAIAVDRAGAAHVVGTTASANWPTTKPVQGTKGAGNDAFVVKLDTTGRGPLFSSFVGGRDADAGMGVAVDAQGVLHLLGITGSSDFPSVKPVPGSRPAAGGDAFVATLDPVDVAAPADTPTAAPAGSSTSTSGHDRRVRTLFGFTMALLLAAVAQTVYLRRRIPVAAPPRAKPAPLPSATPGLKMLETSGSGAKKSGATVKAPMAPRSARAPKSRGGPKDGSAQKGGGPQKKGAGKASELAVDPTQATSLGEGVELVDDGGPPTVATPPVPRVKPQEPAIAKLLAEDLWGDDLPPVSDAPPPRKKESRSPEHTGTQATPSADTAREATPEPEVQWAPFDTGSTPAVSPHDPAEPGAAIPPVPAEELSFWDLFPEDLPPARATPFPAEDLLADHLALPEGPDSEARRLVEAAPEHEPVARSGVPAESPPPPPPPPPRRERPPHAPEAEIVIAELLDGPVPTGLRPSAESPWAPQPDDDFFIDDLLAD